MKEQDIKTFIVIGENIRRIRAEKGFSQQDVANRCDVDRAKISSIENSKEDFVFTTLLEISRALNVDILEIICPKQK
ncbi:MULTISPECIES: helix-turn-helix domain-containing protein [unclassified Sphingobacterium]|uniref:helix-turn-helix domain-containing protein n=1 Tax=unclassified Sphingobacterium TaxID=2609468 RepID=UPI0025FAF422|nr:MULTISPECIES: helix-turn-helix transcriptional regulator [unclassified Sphingobacterium]